LRTEFIYSGTSIGNIIKILEKNKIKFDIAAVSVAKSPKSYDRQIAKHLYYGNRGEQDVGRGGLYFYNTSNISGVMKVDVPDAIHPAVYLDADKIKMKEARKDIDLIADELVKLV
ncbi:hypothetical protein M1513_01090, partial [Patescibacteria group bacterium]|nr:hypothetical protein [Patescibacteria group bacterium]